MSLLQTASWPRGLAFVGVDSTGGLRSVRLKIDGFRLVLYFSSLCHLFYPKDTWARPPPPQILFFPGSIAKGSSSKSGCQLHLPTSHANLSRVTSPANFSCQLVESYFTCQLLMPTCRELLHLPTSHVNFLRVTSPANLSCQLVGCYLILLKAQANLSDFSCQLFGCYLILLKAQANLSGVTSLS